jgi:FG-GAP repeat.
MSFLDASRIRFVAIVVGILTISTALPQQGRAANVVENSSSSNTLTSPTPPLFAPVTIWRSGGYWANAVAFADLNGDGRSDVVVANCGSSGVLACPGGTSDQLGVLLGRGDGSFGPTTTYDSGGFGGTSVAVADLNGDDRLDVVVANFFLDPNTGAEGGVGVLLGNGDGTLRTARSYLSGAVTATSLSIADVNADGRPDLVVANSVGVAGGCYGGCIGILLGIGDGTFHPAVLYGAGPQSAYAVAVADLNGDGKLDLAVTNQCINSSSCPDTAGVEVLLGKGDGSFQVAIAYGSGGYDAMSVAVDDVNADGAADIVVANVCADAGCRGLIGVLLGNGDGTFRRAATYDSGGYYANSVVIADVNGDGNVDLTVAHSCLSASSCLGGVGILVGNGAGTFSTPVIYSSGAFVAWGVAVGDLNGDGKADIIAANESAGGADGYVGVLLNETVFDDDPPVITLSADPAVLWPPDGRMTPVSIFGTIRDAGSVVDVDSASYIVRDEYAKAEVRGSVTLEADGHFVFDVLLQALRVGSDANGRRYFITVQAKDKAGNQGSETRVVLVAHDQRP